ncbi:MAG TPA: WhiB family transcriptional regulator [Actinomycetota bacterium]|nr:WhiB family transcriptional regulator [Actinomycetota bacterium]
MIEPRFRHDPGDTWWAARAGCIGEDPDLFFPAGTSPAAIEQTERAKAVCSRCDVRPECLRWSLDTFQDAGVWGGLDEEERRQIRRARRSGTAASDDELIAV